MPYRPGKGLGKIGATLIAALLFLAGCRSIPREAAAYVAPLPPEAVLTASLHAGSLPPGLENSIFRVYGDDIAGIMKRTAELNLSLFDDGAAELLLEGNFPRFRTSLALGFSRSWELTGRNPDTWTLREADAQVSLPEGGTLLFSSLGTDRMLRAWEDRFERGLVRENDLVILIPEMKNFSPGLPLGGECRIVGTWRETDLELSFLWRFEDARQARTALPLAKLLLWGFMKGLDPDFDRRTLSSRIDGSEVQIGGIRMNPGSIEQLLTEYVDLQAWGRIGS